VILVEGVRKRFSRRGRWVLDGVDLAVPNGARTVVAAANGAGKSTLLRIVAGASAPTAGHVRGRPASAAYVPERAPVRLRMTASQYLAHMGRLRGLSARTVRTRAGELCERLDLRPGPAVPIIALSKGNSQKVAVIQAFLHPVELLVLDEPYTGLDADASRVVGELLTEAERDGAAVLVSAHEHAAAAFLLAEGRLRAPNARPDRLMRLVLTPAGGHASIDDLSPLAREVIIGPGRVTVRTVDADRLLGLALARGWSLLEARPEDPA